MKKRILVLLISLFTYYTSHAQLEEIFAARDDAATYTKQYLSPAMNGFMYNFNNGWYSSGKTHKKFGFDITISASTSIVPDDKKYFTFIAADYNYLSVESGSNIIPTVAGGETNTILEVSDGDDSFTFDAIDGVGDEWPEDFPIPVSIPSPMVQIGFGLPNKTDIKLRFFPNTNKDNVSYNLMGIGIQHNISQYFKIIKDIPTLNISALAAYTGAGVEYVPDSGTVDGSNQSMEMHINTYTVQVIGDIDLKFINFYLGMGYYGGNTDLDALGSYEFDYDDNGTIESDEIIVDPLKMDFAISGVKTTVGTRLNLGPVKIFADYTLQKYNSITAGLAISIR